MLTTLYSLQFLNLRLTLISLIYRFSQGKSEPLDNIYSLFKQNINRVMLGGEGNENGEKTTVGLISKKATLPHGQYTFFVHFFAVVLLGCNVKLPETFLVTRFMEEMSYVFSFTFFTTAHFHLALVAAGISHFVTTARKCSCSSSRKKCLLCFFFISRSRFLSPFFSLSFEACRLLSLFLCLSLAIYSNVVDLTI